MELKRKILQKIPVRLSAPLRLLMQRLAVCGVALLLSNAAVVGDLRPLGLGFAAAAPTGLEIWAAAGAAIGSLLFCNLLDALKYTGAAVLCVIVRITLHKPLMKLHRQAAYPLCAFICVLPCSVATLAASGFSGAGFLLCVCESVLTGAAAFLWGNLFLLLSENGLVTRTDEYTRVSVLIAAGGFALALMPLKPFGFPVADVLLGLLILVWAYCAGVTGGCLAGVCCGCIAGMSAEGIYTMLSCGFGGLLAGLCMPAGRSVAGIGYFVACLLTMIIGGVTGNPVLYCIANGVAVILFAVLPQKLLDRIRPFVSPYDAHSTAEQTRSLFNTCLLQTGQAVTRYADSVETVTKRLTKLSQPEVSDISRTVRAACCSDCHRHSFCWEHELPGMRSAFSQAVHILQRDGVLTAASLPDKLTVLCRRNVALTECFNDSYRHYLQRCARTKDMLSVRSMAASQLKTAAFLLEDVAHNRLNGQFAAPAAAQAARSVLQNGDDGFSDVSARTDAQGHLFIHVSFTAPRNRHQLKKTAAALAAGLGVDMAAPVPTDDSGLHFCFAEAPDYSVLTATGQQLGSGETYCGDSYAGFRDAFGRFVMILSDGMGTGERAALDSLMASSLTATLLKAGISVQCAVSMVNAALLLRCAQETMATLDIAVIDLFTGHTQLYKAGASFSVLQNKRGTAIIEQQTLPLGILNDTDLACTEFDLQEGDTLLLLSDGAAPLPASCFKELLGNRQTMPIREAVNEITRQAVNACPSGKTDDITCVAAQLVRR